jgi:predicted amidophosphoribosyltransferase
MLFVKERLESIQSYHWLYKDNIPKPNTLCGYCQEHNKDFDDDEACKQCLKDME